MPQKPVVFFNASVIMAGIYSPSGGSAKCISWVKNGKVKGVVSEIILDEATKHAIKIHKSEKEIVNFITLNKFKIVSAPKNVKSPYQKIVKDVGDVHLFVSTQEVCASHLVSLDKKHVLSIKKKISKFSIVSPGELIEILSEP